MSTEANVKQLVADLEHGMGDQTRIDHEFDEVVEAIGRMRWWTEATLVETTAEAGEYSRPIDALEVLEVFYDDRALGRATVPELEVDGGPQWRDRRGTPMAWTLDGFDDGTFRLYPVPQVSSKSFIFALGAPFGTNYPEYAAVVLANVKRPITFQPWLELLAALLICSREFRREGQHRDPDFADACEVVAQLVIEYLS